MIDVQIRGDGIVVTGHANYAPRGQDIVCAAVSALVQSLVTSAEYLAEEEVTSVMEDGKAEIYFDNLTGSLRDLVLIFYLGICDIVDSYPEYVRLM